MNYYDAIIIGSGQAGNPLAKAFANAGRKTALIERAYIGGSCINYGCTPTKTMFNSARVAYLVSRAAAEVERICSGTCCSECRIQNNYAVSTWRSPWKLSVAQ